MVYLYEPTHKIASIDAIRRLLYRLIIVNVRKNRTLF